MARLADHSEFTIGDYIYFVRSSSKGTVSPRPVDTTKESYADLVSPITYNEETYIITDLDGWKKSETGSDSYTGYGSFRGCTNLVTPPTLPSSVTSMRKTFFECTSLKTAPDIPSGVTDMMECFYHCSALETGPEVIPSGVTNVIRLFCGCTLLQNAPALPENAKSLTATFGDCASLTHPPVIPASVTNMWSTFDGCINLEEAPELPAGLTVIKFAFNNCKKITTAPVIPAGITDMSAVFQGCESLQLPPEIPDGVTTLYFTFKDCMSLQKVPVIPNSVTNMEAAFNTCPLLTQPPEIPSGVTNVKRLFRGCTSLQNAPVLPNNIDSLAYTFTYCESIRTPPVIPDGVTDLDSTFAGCTSLSKAPSIPNGVTNMRFTFNDCPITETPLIPENVENMLATFQGCTLITTMSNIPSKVTALKQTFMGCTSLVNFTEIPSTVTSLHLTFRECTFENPPVIPNNVTNMRATFYKCTSLLTAPAIPNSVTDMGACFTYCEKITEPPSLENTAVTNLKETFWGTSLTSPPVLPNSVTDMASCFYDCVELITAPEIPDSVNSITFCFRGCKKLAIAPDMYNIAATDLTCTFAACDSLDWSLSPALLGRLPKSATILDRTFMNCTSLQYSPEIPSTVENMNSCFDGCTSLKRAPSIPASIKNLNECFEHCTSLEGNMVVDADLSSFIPFEYDGIFNDTAKDIYIIDMSGGEERVWSWIASSYDNVHYGFNDVTNPNCLFSVYRVMADGDEIPQKKGNYIFIRLITKYYTNYAPEGTQVSCELPTLYMDGTSLSTEDWTIESAEGQKTYKMWVNPNDYDQHMFVTSQDVQYSVSVSSPRVFTYTKVKAVPSSQIILEKLYALINAYHDPTSGNEGIAFGTFALTTEPQFLVNLPERHLDEVTFESNRYIGLNDYEVEGSIHKQIFDAIVALGWTDVLSEDPTIGIELNYYSYDLYTYDSSTQSLPHYVQLIATPTPYTATVTWTSSDPLVASVDNTGYVTAINEDATQTETPVTITASITAHGSTVTATCEIIVHSFVF